MLYSGDHNFLLFITQFSTNIHKLLNGWKKRFSQTKMSEVGVQPVFADEISSIKCKYE